MKTTHTTNQHYQLFVYDRKHPTYGWRSYSYERKTLAKARKAAKDISLRFDWRIAYVKTVYKFIAQSSRKLKKEKCPVPKDRVPACKQWPNCACIVRGNVRQCDETPRLRPRPLPLAPSLRLVTRIVGRKAVTTRV